MEPVLRYECWRDAGIELILYTSIGSVPFLAFDHENSFTCNPHDYYSVTLTALVSYCEPGIITLNFMYTDVTDMQYIQRINLI